MQMLNKSDEQKLFDGVKKAADLVDNAKLSPNDALHKVALDLSYSPGFLEKACHAFNTGRQLAQWQANDSVLDKLANFPLADYTTIHERIWGQPQEKAAQVVFQTNRIPTYDSLMRTTLAKMELGEQEKTAAAEVSVDVDQLFHQHYHAQRQEKQAQTEKTAAEMQLNQQLSELVRYFQKSAYDRLSLAEVEHATGIEYGKAGQALMEVVAAHVPQEKRAKDYRASWSGFHKPVNFTSAPYTLITQAIKAASHFNRTTAALKTAQEKTASCCQKVNTLKAKYQKQDKKPQKDSPYLIDHEKAGFSHVLPAAGAYLPDLSYLTNPDRTNMVQSQMKKLDSPDHVNELRKIRTQTVLNSLMSDPDNPLSEHNPEEVLNAYNEMIRLAPRLADQPALLNPLLNKRLAGRMEPFELGEALKLETGLKSLQQGGGANSLTQNQPVSF